MVKNFAQTRVQQILVVEDNLADFRRLVEHLKENDGDGFQVSHAANMAAAQNQIASSHFDVILLDMNLPDSRGIETFQAIKNVVAETPVVILSGLDSEEFSFALLSEGAQDFLSKNIDDPETIVRRIRYAIQRKSAQSFVSQEQSVRTSVKSVAAMIELIDSIEASNTESLVHYDRVKAMVQSLKSSINSRDLEDLFTELSSIASQLSSAKRDASNELQNSFAIIGKLTRELSEANALARTDQLTGLANRRIFDGELDRAIEAAATGKSTTSLLMIDVDQFKLFNDRWGHQAGDIALRVVGQILNSAFLDCGLVARYGGEEFAIITTQLSSNDVYKFAEFVRQKIAEQPIFDDASDTNFGTLSISIGISFFNKGDTSFKFIKRADEALYRAKALGRDRIELAS